MKTGVLINKKYKIKICAFHVGEHSLLIKVDNESWGLFNV